MNNQPPSQVCKYCYGKGYSSVMFDEIGSPDLGSKGFVNKRKEIQKPCRCQDELSTTCPICEDDKCHWDCGEEETSHNMDCSQVNTFLAEKVMDWETSEATDLSEGIHCKSNSGKITLYFEPCRDANHLEIVLREVMKEKGLELFEKYALIIAGEHMNILDYCNATTEQKARAIVEAYLLLSQF